MDILLVMCIGVLIGNRFFPEKWKKGNEKAQIICTVLLIFFMGVKIGKMDNIWNEIASMGLTSFLFFFIPSLFSLILVYVLTRIFMKSGRKGDR